MDFGGVELQWHGGHVDGVYVKQPVGSVCLSHSRPLYTVQEGGGGGHGDRGWVKSVSIILGRNRYLLDSPGHSVAISICFSLRCLLSKD